MEEKLIVLLCTHRRKENYSSYFVDLNLDVNNQEVENGTVKIYKENDDVDQV